MGPKKVKGKAIDTVDGVDTTKMNREQLEIYAHKILEEMEREREERNFFQLERDKLRTFWEITRQQLDEARAVVRNKEREKEELVENHEAELKLYKQKVKHLMYEHQTNLSETKAEHLVALKLAQDDHFVQENELIKDKTNLKKVQKEQELAYMNEIRALKLHNSEEMNNIIKKFESEAIELEQKYEQKLTSQYESLILKHRMELTEIEERKNAQIANLIKNHENAFTEMKNYYNDITLNNLSLIKSMKEQMEMMRSNEERMKKQVRELTTENKKYLTDLKTLQETITELNRQLTNYEKDKQCLVNTKRRLSAVTKDLENLKLENEVLELRFEKCQSERDELHSRFVSAIFELQQKTGLKNVLLEKKLEKLSDLLEQREAQISEVLAAAQLDPAAVVNMNKKLEDMLNRKNTAIQDLQYELAKVCKAHDDLLAVYESKLQEYGIPKTELGFQPLRMKINGAKLGLGPAGLVTANQ
ncbi:PREDICTED: growth arrest-specific protein 8 [Trachymyrmex septentrionalis]|uniref:growth arrest-specific protein 8 n=1 Tax=Trachymyrmex septentrionalis TaxID=34720 RepID=UPI00084F5E12|nr:PREDICTED: growth arrest-specific protein 8 [Trachymyrmex septentrionalis]